MATHKPWRRAWVGPVALPHSRPALCALKPTMGLPCAKFLQPILLPYLLPFRY